MIFAFALVCSEMALADTASCNIYEYPDYYIGYPSILHIRNYSAASVATCVNDLYQSTLNRAADPGGASYVSFLLTITPLNPAAKPSSLRRQMAASPEAGTLINNLYVQLLGRSADPDGLAYWRGVLGTYGLGYNAVVAGLKSSPEYRRRVGL